MKALQAVAKTILEELFVFNLKAYMKAIFFLHTHSNSNSEQLHVNKRVNKSACQSNIFNNIFILSLETANTKSKVLAGV